MATLNLISLNFRYINFDKYRRKESSKIMCQSNIDGFWLPDWRESTVKHYCLSKGSNIYLEDWPILGSQVNGQWPLSPWSLSLWCPLFLPNYDRNTNEIHVFASLFYLCMFITPNLKAQKLHKPNLFTLALCLSTTFFFSNASFSPTTSSPVFSIHKHAYIRVMDEKVAMLGRASEAKK